MQLSEEELQQLQEGRSQQLRDVCQSPMLLMVLCILCSEHTRQLPSSRSGVYKELHEFSIKKAAGLQSVADASDGALYLYPLVRAQETASQVKKRGEFLRGTLSEAAICACPRR